MGSKALTIDETLAGLIAGTVTDDQVISGQTGTTREAWLGYELINSEWITPYYRICRAWPKALRPVLSAPMSEREVRALYAAQEKALED